MEKRIGLVAVLVTTRDTQNISRLNDILARFHDIIMARQGLPLHHRGIHLVSLVVEGSNDDIGALSGQLGRLPGISAKSVHTQYKEDTNEHDLPD